MTEQEVYRFTIDEINTNFDEVSRIKSEDLEIDVNNIFFDFYENVEKGIVGLTGLIGKEFELSILKKIDQTNLINYDYVMHGKLFKKEGNSFYVSFGGLLAKMDNFDEINNLSIDEPFYCLMNALND